MSGRRFLLALFALLVPTVADATDGFIQPKKKDGPLIHRASGFSFPARIGGFRRVSPHQFDDTGDDISVGYNLLDPVIVATIYVYPVGAGDLEGEFARRQKELTDHHSEAQLLGQGEMTVNPQKTRALGAEYTYSDNFAGAVVPLRSVLLVAQHGRWFVEYRISYRAEGQEESRKLARQLTQDFAWP